MPVETLLLPPDQLGIDRAAALLQAGENVAFPTETVYGLGGDASSDRAVAGIFAAKDRPDFNPLIVHLPDLAAALNIARFSAGALALARTFWPGPLTLVLPLRPDAGISPLVTAGLDTVAIRVPAHPLAHRLLARFGGPVAAPSANPSGRISPTRADHVMAGLAGRIAAVLDGGRCPVGVESTIIGFTDGPEGGAHLLRPGGLALERIEALLRHRLSSAVTGAKPVAPGQLASHYAPRAVLRLNAAMGPGAVHLAFGRSPAPLNLSPAADLTEAAANLFHLLRRADDLAGPGGLITVAPIPMRGLGLAINDRLQRAAAPRG